MPKKKVFVSFDFETDYELKATLIGQSRLPDSPFAITDVSLDETHIDPAWVSKAQSAIAGCNVFIVLLGANTHNAPGVIREVTIAKGLGKDCFQLRPRGKPWPELKGAGEVVTWRWKNLKRRLTENRH